MVTDISIINYNYSLPDERIARHPLAERDSCRVMLSRPDGTVSDRKFTELPGLLPFSSLLVANDTRVINARMSFRKPTGSCIEIFLLEPLYPSDYVLMFQSKGHCRWNCMVGNLKRWKEGNLEMMVAIPGMTVPMRLTAIKGAATTGNSRAVEFIWDNPDVTFAEIVDAAGKIPIPPYLKRESEASDKDDYQTVYAEVKGSVAAPTAGLHFTPRVLADIKAHNIEVRHVTLHVGAGTFQPVKSETIGGHPMHTETFSVDMALIESLIKALECGRKVTAVGTTTVRTLESLPYVGAKILKGEEDLSVEQWAPYVDGTDFNTVECLHALKNWLLRHGLNVFTGSTSIMIAPGFRWRIVDCLVTNFHQPQSTLLLLVSSFLNRAGEGNHPQWKDIYGKALANESYRFLSYGDACLLYPVEK